MARILSVLMFFMLATYVSASLVDTCSPSSIFGKRRLATRGLSGDCCDTWSRCSRWSSGLTGSLWETCDECCRIKGRSGGTCEKAPSKCPLTDYAWQCQCY